MMTEPDKKVRTVSNSASQCKHPNGLTKLVTHDKPLALARENQLNSPLLLLPAEIRVKIFEYVLSEKIHLRYRFRTDRNGPIYSGLACSSPINCVALLRVSRQIYMESALLQFQFSTFSFHSPSDLTMWLRQILPCQRVLVENIEAEVRITGWKDAALAQNLANAFCFTLCVMKDEDFAPLKFINFSVKKLCGPPMDEALVTRTIEHDLVENFKKHLPATEPYGEPQREILPRLGLTESAFRRLDRIVFD